MSRRLISTGSPFEKAAGYSRAVDASDADALFAVCGEVLGDIRPAATLLIVASLLKPEMKVEIEITAKHRSA
jgi:hypothetical protein